MNDLLGLVMMSAVLGLLLGAGVREFREYKEDRARETSSCLSLAETVRQTVAEVPDADFTWIMNIGVYDRCRELGVPISWPAPAPERKNP